MRFINRSLKLLLATTTLFSFYDASALAQVESTRPSDAAAPVLLQPTELHNGPHGGHVKIHGEFRIETLVSPAGLKLYVFDSSNKAVPIHHGRGVAVVTYAGRPKRYRYDLLPDDEGSMQARINWSPHAGDPIDVEIRLAGIAGMSTPSIAFAQTATIPYTDAQKMAAAIARQKTCPVSTKLLGSMGDPIPVDVEGKTVYVCCVGCVTRVQATPATFAKVRPEIIVSIPTEEDAAAIAAQGVCPVMDAKLGSMGQPMKVAVGDKTVYLCCRGCIRKLKAEPMKYVSILINRPSQP